MKVSSLRFLGLMLAASVAMPAQQGTLSGPVAGFVFDHAAHALRPIQGVPGASLLGDSMSFGFDVAAVYVAPRQDSAIVVGADQSLHLFALNGATPAEVSLQGISGAPERVVFSPSGTAVALMSKASTRILTGLPSAPELTGSIKAPARLIDSGARIQAVRQPSFALSDDGTYALTVADGSVRLLSVQGQNRSLMPALPTAELAFAPGGHDAAVMDTNSGLTLIRNASAVAASQVLAAPDDGLADPVGVAFSQDGATVYVASAKAHAVAAFNLAAASRTAVACGCTPSTIAPMGNLFRLTEMTAGPLWLLDGTRATPRTVFVPARSE